MRSVETSAGTIEVDDQGDGPAVVLLHGLLMDHTLWDQVLPLLPTGFRYLRPVLPLGAHRIPMRPDADLTLDGQVRLVAELLDRLELPDVTLVHSDWGGALMLTARGLDERVSRMVMLPCEAFDNFPPGLPGRTAALAARLPGGIGLAGRMLRVGRLRQMPTMFGQMARDPVPDQLIRRWTTPILASAQVRRDVRNYAKHRFDARAMVADTEALSRFAGPALVLWSPDNRVMPAAHGRRLAELMPSARYAEVPGAFVLSQLDEPAIVAAEIGAFLTETT